MAERPTTREEAIEIAQAWAAGEYSHWSTMVQYAEPDRASVVALTAQMDVAEVQKYVALASVLPAASEVRP